MAHEENCSNFSILNSIAFYQKGKDALLSLQSAEPKTFSEFLRFLEKKSIFQGHFLGISGQVENIQICDICIFIVIRHSRKIKLILKGLSVKDLPSSYTFT